MYSNHQKSSFISFVLALGNVNVQIVEYRTEKKLTSSYVERFESSYLPEPLHLLKPNVYCFLSSLLNQKVQQHQQQPYLELTEFVQIFLEFLKYHRIFGNCQTEEISLWLLKHSEILAKVTPFCSRFPSVQFSLVFFFLSKCKE